MSTLRRFELVAALVTACTVGAPIARADEDSLAPYRDRFRQGMEKYRAGAMAEAIRAWSAIYEEIGPHRGYRLSFNLARAYETNSETSRAAERYQSFLDEVAVRREAGEALDALVEREATEAQRRLDDLNSNNGRIRIVSGARAVLVQIDGADPRLGTFVTYVAPGDHVVVFAPGSGDQERHDVSVKAGDVVELSPPPPSEASQRAASAVALRNPLPDLNFLTETKRPFPAVVIYVSAGVTAASLVAPILSYAHAESLVHTYYRSNTSFSQKPGIASDYYAARTTAYATLAIPLALSAVTGSLLFYYFAGSKERPVSLAGGALPGGVAASLSGCF